ncbi:MAG TPA: 5-oxoprolinase subunit PxpA [Candidatus Krumholzibacteria bacterium]|nr:5-oxoprolinase subunit PxpA [Candidatus Krumholzibacteria bacterium]
MILDLNCDMGEVPSAIEDGTQEMLMHWITSANVACGGHAGDQHTMTATVEQALRANVAIGAHPGYPDRARFGRHAMDMPVDAVRDFVFEQVRALSAVTDRLGAAITHVKPHGALYNQAVRNAALAEAIAQGVKRWSGDVVLVGLAGSPMLDVFRDCGFTAAAEAFADRRYQPDGTLRSRSFDDALIRDPTEAAQQALNIAASGSVTAHNGDTIALSARTICIHGDTPGALQIVVAVAETLREAGITLRALSNRQSS